MTRHTYAILEISQTAYDEIRSKLAAAGYEHAFHDGGVIDMHGIAVQALPAETPTPTYIRPKPSAVGSSCQIEMMNAGMAYPRTCPTCGLFGKCAKGLVRKERPT